MSTGLNLRSPGPGRLREFTLVLSSRASGKPGLRSAVVLFSWHLGSYAFTCGGVRTERGQFRVFCADMMLLIFVQGARKSIIPKHSTDRTPAFTLYMSTLTLLFMGRSRSSILSYLVAALLRFPTVALELPPHGFPYFPLFLQL